ncbi:MAG: 2-oxoacid:acceptor oxidoreductase subunit alpha [Thermaerobacter sp.]|nr:2-oxoacid:acceptor oxidoreductase subunit alpha [Bacillota bacterium]REJ36731.1 MAG: 2-oxoacid:acceptor oxidoreductase subunit alpha [Bacillota bacterium]
MTPATVDLTVTIGGDAGQGIESSGTAFARALMRAGWHIFTMVDYRSRIRGGHNFYQIRVSDRPLYSHSDPVHLLLAMTEETLKIHLDNLAPGAAVIYDEGFKRVDRAEIEAAGVLAFPAPLSRLAARHGSKVMMNTAALGAAAGLLGVDLEPIASVIHDNFGRKGSRVAEANQEVLREARDWAAAELARREGGQAGGNGQDGQAPSAFRYRLGPRGPVTGRRMAIHGNHALALGAVAGGCRFAAAYPMTPGTSLFEFLTAHSHRTGVVTKHAEDEIAAMCMVVGAAHAGARALTTTSGGGFSLMVEALGMAGMVELPVVIVVAQRGGPSTGLPTRTEQGDLLFAVHASQGEFPRIVLAPGTIEDCFEAGWRAFNLAESFQCPVIILTDQYLASSLRDLPAGALDRRGVVIDRGPVLTASDLDALAEPYLRFRDTPSGVSPRAIPGHPKGVYALTTDEHDEESHITEEIGSRVQQMAKRMRKLDSAAAAMRGPRWYGPPDAEVTLICWGSLYGPCRDAVDRAAAAGRSVNMLHFSDLWPLPEDEVNMALAMVNRAVAVEQNYSGQFARLLRMVTGFEVEATLNKFDGRQFTPGEILEGLEEAVGAHA